MEHFEDHYLAEQRERIALPFEEEPKFFDPEEAHEADEFRGAPQVEDSIYTDDPVRVYLREMGAVPLLTREGEVDKPFSAGTARGSRGGRAPEEGR